MDESGDAFPDPVDASPQPGVLLVALPTLQDPNFHRTVVLMLAAGPAGALGVVLNRAQGLPVRAILPAWAPLACDPASMFVGGPVARSSVIAVGRARPAGRDVEGVQLVTGDIATVDLNREVDELEGALDGLRIFSGYAGWGEGQLEDEIGSGSWALVAVDDDDVLTDDPAGLWSRVLRRQGGRLALYANAPPDLTMN